MNLDGQETFINSAGYTKTGGRSTLMEGDLRVSNDGNRVEHWSEAGSKTQVTAKCLESSPGLVLIRHRETQTKKAEIRSCPHSPEAGSTLCKATWGDSGSVGRQKSGEHAKEFVLWSPRERQEEQAQDGLA